MVLVRRFEVLAAVVEEAAEPLQVYAMQQSPADFDGSLKDDDLWKGDAQKGLRGAEQPPTSSNSFVAFANPRKGD